MKYTLLPDELADHIDKLLDNSYCSYGGDLWKIIQGFQTGTNCGPWMANLYLVYYELKFVHRKLKIWNQISRGLQIFLINYHRYIDDIFWTVGDDFDYQEVLYFDDESDGIYPKRLKNLDGSTVENPFQVNGEALTSADYLDVTLTVTNHGIVYTPYNKREHMKVNNRKLSEFRNFPHCDSQLSWVCKLGVLNSQMFRFNNRSSTQKGFIHETVFLAKKMLRDNYPLGGVLRMIMKYRRWRGGEMGEWPKVQRVLRAKILKYANRIQITKWWL